MRKLIENWKWQLAQKLEIRWWQQYLRNKDVNEYLQAKKAYWQRVLETINLKVPDQSLVLDAGCGPAGVFMVLPDQKVMAIDPLLEQYKNKNHHFNPLNYPWTTFKRLGLEELDIKNHFDYVFCLNVINHVKDIDRALDNLVNATKSGATLVLSIDVHRYNSLKKIFQFLPGDVLHPHQYNRTDYKAMLEKRDCHLLQSHCLKSGNIFDYWILVARCP
ncbi:MAG: class I SAM-dependent methyltransferase [Bacteroidota bacterium]